MRVSAGAILLALDASTNPTLAAAPPGVTVTAPIALMTDLGSGRVLYSREARRRFMPASLTKIMTAYVAFELIAAHRLQPNQRFTVSDAAFAKWRGVGSTMFLARGQSVAVDDLLKGVMTVSANDGSIVLAEGIAGSVGGFTARMNAQARALGMVDSHFGSPNGWPDEGATYTSARDLATLTEAMLTRHPALYRHYVGHRQMAFNGIVQHNHVPIIGSVPGADGVKTGFTNESGFGFVGSAVRGGRRLVMVVAGFDSARDRNRQSREFLEWGFNAWDARRLFERGAEVAEARVQNGAARHVALIAPRPYFLTLGEGETPRYRLAVRYRGPLEAPIAKGQVVGDLELTMAGQPPRQLPLVAAAEVPVAGFWARLRNGLFGLVGL